MRILLASDFFPPTPGGMEAHVQRLAEALILRGHEVAIVTGTAQPDPLPGRAVIIPTSTVLAQAPHLFRDGARPFPPPYPDALFRRSVRRIASWWRPDVIHAHGWCAFSCYWPDAPPLVVTLHDHGLRCSKKTLLRDGKECLTGRGTRCITCTGSQPLLKRLPLTIALGHSIAGLVAHTSRFIAVSESVARRFKELGPATFAVHIVPNFLEVGVEALSTPASPPIVLFVGPDAPHKGRSIAIDAFRRLPPGPAQLHLVGSNTSVGGAGITTLGYMRSAELLEQYQRASVLVAPAVWPEPCPTVVLEAMAQGLPAIGSRIGGIPDLVEHERSGLLVTPNDSVALADSLRRVLTDHPLRQRLGIGARARSEQFDTSAVVPRIETIYASACRIRVPI